MNTIDNVPEHELADRTAQAESVDAGAQGTSGSRADRGSSFTGTSPIDGHDDLGDNTAHVAQVRNEPEVSQAERRDAKERAKEDATQPEGPQSPSTNDKEAEHGTTKAAEREEEAEHKVLVPKSLAKRYLIAENKFYFRDDPNLMAFEDKGKRLSTEHNDPQVAQSMVELAHAKNWSSIKVNGSIEFKREVWLAGSLRGLEVQGYAPRAVDKARLAELQSELQDRHQNSIELGTGRERTVAAPSTAPTAESNRPQGTEKPDAADDSHRNLTKQQRVAVDTLRTILTERGDFAQAVEMAANVAAERFGHQRVYVGRLLSHGPAPYEHKPDEKNSYFITLKTPYGEQTIWGVDLERAVGAANVKPGEDLALVARGKKKVTVLAHERDAAGELTGRQSETIVDRNSWEVGKLDKMREEAQVRVRAAAEHTARNQPEVRVYDVPSPPQRQVAEADKARGREQAPSR
jgi:hypothetical protein